METTEFVTAEHTTNPGRGVWVLLTTISAMLSTGVYPARFEITTSTGYKAILPACLRDDCLAGAIVSCGKAAHLHGQPASIGYPKWREHARTHCHSWHLAHAEAFAAEVGKTYKRKAR